jgi:hypothetical protein
VIEARGNGARIGRGTGWSTVDPIAQRGASRAARLGVRAVVTGACNREEAS